MTHRITRIGLATATLIAAGLVAAMAPSAAMTGIGCPDLPLYYRAVGTIENGPGSCGLTTEEANRILARGPNGDGVVPGQSAAPAPRKHYRRAKHHD